MSYRTRLALPEDDPLLYEVFRFARDQEVSSWNWSFEEISSFLHMQWEMQRKFYSNLYPSAQNKIILRDHAAAGRYLLHTGTDHMRLVDIALLPVYRNQGLGTCVLQQLQADARTRSIPLFLSVALVNRARGLYKRLGFEDEGLDEAGMYVSMKWMSNSTTT